MNAAERKSTEPLAPEEKAPAESPDVPAKGRPSDRYLTIVIWVLVIGLLAFAAYFVYDFRATRRAQEAANPAYQVITQAKAAVKKNPNEPQGRLLLAQAYAAVGKLGPAKRELKTALKLNPKYVNGYLALAKLGMIEKDYDVAKNALKKVLELTKGGEYEQVNKGREEAYFYLGEIALLEREYEDAVGYLKASIRIRRDASDTYLRLAQAYIGLGETDPAIQNLQVALAFEPKFSEANYEMGKLLLKTDKASAAEYLRIAADNAPDAEEPEQTLATLGDWRKYVAEGREALEADPPKALEAGRIAFALAQKEFDAALLLAEAYEANGMQTEALTAYRTASNLRPDDKAVVEAVRRLEAAPKGGAK